jgi:hypothetical protein
VRQRRRTLERPRPPFAPWAWYLATDLSLADEAAVMVWPDASGNGNHLDTHPGAGTPPIYRANVDGHPGVDMESGAFGAGIMASVTPTTFDDAWIYLVYTRGSYTSTSHQSMVNLYGQHGASQLEEAFLSFTGTTARMRATVSKFLWGNAFHRASATTSVTASTPKIITGVRSPSGVRCRDGSDASGSWVATNSPPALESSELSAVILGESVKGVALECLVFLEPVADATDAAVMAYLTGKFG